MDYLAHHDTRPCDRFAADEQTDEICRCMRPRGIVNVIHELNHFTTFSCPMGSIKKSESIVNWCCRVNCDWFSIYVTFAPRATKFGTICLLYATCHVFKTDRPMITADRSTPSLRFFISASATGSPITNNWKSTAEWNSWGAHYHGVDQLRTTVNKMLDENYLKLGTFSMADDQLEIWSTFSSQFFEQFSRTNSDPSL